ncbi:MAG: L,D-transpeptidase family protein [Verrucomicrobiota bacterium]|nr:L,D-transpeptidase family protein [Verrucomicrobiota bacterium]
MYFHVKVIIAFILLMTVLGVLYIFRNEIENLDVFKDSKEQIVEKQTLSKDDQNLSEKNVITKQTVPTVIKTHTHTQEITKLRKFYEALHKVEGIYRNGKILSARNIIYKILDNKLVDEKTKIFWKSVTLLGKINSRIIFSDIPVPEKKSYTVKSGDTLVGISKKNNTTVSLLQQGNSLDPANSVIFPGQTLLLYPANWRILIYKNYFKLLLYDGQKIFKAYDIAIGRQNRTPVGNFIVKNKQKEPVWTPPGRHIPYGDPENVLGTRWIGLMPTKNTSKHLSGYGIHGTWEPESIGTEASKGCIRMRNEDVNELFDFVSLNVPVTIK